MEKPTIDAVEMTRRIRDANAERMKEIPAAERVWYYRDRARRARGVIAAVNEGEAAAEARGT